MWRVLVAFLSVLISGTALDFATLPLRWLAGEIMFQSLDTILR